MNTRPLLACRWCGASFPKRRRGGDAGLYCSRACAFACRAALKDLRIGPSAGDVAARAAVRALVRAERQALKRIARYVEKPRVFRHPCRTCGVPFRTERNGGLHRIVCDTCRADAQYIAQQAANAARRARERGAHAESVNPFEVFQAAGWRCAGCGRCTPRRLRGTCHAQAPELDHVVPLAAGGSHTRGNVQLLCRACNQAKGARVE